MKKKNLKKGVLLTPHDELCNQALEHYQEISNKATDWNSLVPKAIEFYKKHFESR